MHYSLRNMHFLKATRSGRGGTLEERERLRGGEAVAGEVLPDGAEHRRAARVAAAEEDLAWGQGFERNTRTNT